MFNFFKRQAPVAPLELDSHNLNTVSVDSVVDEDNQAEADAVRPILDFVAGRIDALRQLNPVAVRGLDDVTRANLRSGASTLRHTLKSHGWGDNSGWLRSMADYDSLFLALANLHFAYRKTQKEPRIEINETIARIIEPLVYCPNILLSQFLTLPENTHDDADFQVAGALVVMDIVGLSNYFDVLYRKGAEALDDLSHNGRGFLSDISRIVYRFQGDCE